MTEHDREAAPMIAAISAAARNEILNASEKLANAIHVNPTDSEVEVRAKLESIRAGDGKPTDLFMDLCEWVIAVFPEPQPTDAQVLASAATPDLMRHLITAMKESYAAALPMGSARKNLKFESAFLCRLNSPGPRSSAVNHYEEICLAGRLARRDAADSGSDPHGQMDAAVAAGYREFRRLTEPSDGNSRLDQNGAERAATQIQIVEVFRRDGVFDDAAIDRELERRKVKG